MLPSLRSSKTEGQANFVNPGVLLVNARLSTRSSRRSCSSTINVNCLRFDKVETLQRLLFQGEIDKAIGIDVGGGFQ